MGPNGEPEIEGEITAIAPQKRDPSRCSIFIDGAFALGVGADVVLALGLAPGDRVNAEQLRRAAIAEERRRVETAALAYLSARPRSRREVEQRLARRGFDRDLVSAVLNHLTSLGYLDDATFARGWVEARGDRRPTGTRRLAADLRARGVGSEAIDSALAMRDEPTEAALAEALARKRLAALRAVPAHEQARRLLGILLRRGFRGDLARSAVARALNNPEDE
jgi:regulatory protein